MSKPMNKNMFIKTALAGAVATTLCGTAIAADIGTGSTFPKLDGAVFLGANNTKIRFADAGGGTNEDLIKAKIHYFTAGAGIGDSPVLSSLAVDDNSGDAAVSITMTVSTPATATKAIITVDASGAVDKIPGGGDFAYVAVDGTLVAAADEAAAILAAQTAGAFLPVDPTYNTISVTDAKVDVVATPKVAYVTFNADPNIARGDSIAAGAKIDVKEGLASTAIVSATDAGIVGTLADNVHAFLDDDTNAGNEAIGAVTAFGASIVSVANAAGLDDGAGNVPISAGTVDPVVALAPPEYAASGEVMVQDNANANALYDGGVTAIRVNIRLNDTPDALGSWDEAEDVAFNTGAIAGGFGVTADADGNNTILRVTATRAGADLFFADPLTGNITYGADRDSAVPFTAQVKQASTNGGATDLALGLNNAVVITGDLAATQVKVGQVQAPVAASVDSDLDGVIDGVSIDFMQALGGLVAGHNLGLVSYQNDSDLQGAEVARPVNLATDAPTIDATNTMVSMSLTNKDVFDADGNPPATTVNDYNADGTADSDDADFVIPANMDTAADDVQPTAGGIPFKAEIGINTAAAKDDNSEVKTSLTYDKAYDLQTGANLAVATGEFNDVKDGASPVVKRVEYVEDDNGSSGRDPSGTVTIIASEDLAGLAPNVGEFLFDGKPVSLINLDANMDEKVRAEDPTVGDDTDFDLTAVPGTVFGQVLSLGVEPNVEDANGNPLVLSSTAAQNTVVKPAVAAPKIVSAKPLHGASPLKWNKVEVTYDQDIEAPTGAELDGIFVVRARVGAKRGPSFEGRDDEDDYYDFRIPAANVAIAGKVVTLTLPIDDFPADTTQIFVDYEGATQAEIDNEAALNYIQATSNQAPADVGGNDLFYGEIWNGKACFNTEIGETDDPDLVDVCPGIDDDADTVEADVPALFLATHARDNHRKLFTQTVQGTISQTNPTTDDFGPVIDDAGIRIDLVRVTEYNTSGVVAKKAVVSNGAIEVRRGPNSANFNNHAVAGQVETVSGDGQSANDSHNDDSYADQWQNIALLNKAVNVGLITNYYNLKGKISAEGKKLNAAIAEGQSSAQIAKIEENIQKLNNDMETNFGNGTILAYIEVTTGNGKDGVDSSNVNPNANVGRTATLLGNLPNTVRNGTTTYPVWVDLDGGEVWAADYNNGESGQGVNGIQHGFIVINPPQAASPSKVMKKFELLDTAYTHVENGQYKGVVGMVEDSVDSKSKTLTPKYDDAFILVSYRDTNTGDWILTNQAESSFNSSIPFAADLMGDGTPTKHNINVDNIWMSDMPEQEDAIWQLLGMPGVMARDDAKPLDMGRFFITVDTDTGNPITVWENDGNTDPNSSHEMAFSMGLGDKPNAMQVVFELGGNGSTAPLKQYGSLNPADGAAIAYNGDDYAADDSADTGDHDHGKEVDGDHLLNDQTSPDYLFVPMTGTGASADLKEGWHLISLAEAESIATLVGNNSNIDAVIAFVSTAGGGDKVRNYTWFDGDDINAAENNAILPKGAGMFIHVNAETSGFSFK